MDHSEARAAHPELSDLIVSFDAVGRTPVRRQDVITALEASGHERSARIARSIASRGEFFDEDDADAILLRSHLELQRLAEEIQHPKRVARLLGPLIELIDRPVRIADIGCGLGFLVRALTESGALGADVEIIGVDFNRTLLDGARVLAEAEGLDCEFIAGDAFELDQPADIYMSTGVIHHFAAADLGAFFARQAAAGAAAAFHFDVAPTAVTPFGAWLFHRARMRERLARHDGVNSALRAHGDQALVDAMRSTAPDWDPLLFDAVGRRLAVLNVMRPIIGIRPDLVDGFVAGLGRLGRRVTRP